MWAHVLQARDVSCLRDERTSHLTHGLRMRALDEAGGARRMRMKKTAAAERGRRSESLLLLLLLLPVLCAPSHDSVPRLKRLTNVAQLDAFGGYDNVLSR